MREVRTFRSKGFDFQITLVLHVEPEVLADQEALQTDVSYRAAFEDVSKFLPFLKSIHAVKYLGQKMQEAGIYDPLFSTHPYVEYTIWAYEKKLISFPESIYQQAIAIRDRVAPAHNRYSRSKKPGYVYLIQSPTGHYKIGRSINPHDRLKTFSVLLPFEIEFIALIKSDDHIGLEKYLHDHFSDRRVNGEWFKLSPDDVEQIKAIAVEAAHG